MKKIGLLKEFARLDQIVSQIFLNDDSPIPSDNLDIANLWLEEDISAALAKSDNIYDTEKEIRTIIQKSSQCSEILECINFEKLMRGASIRQDFASALRSVKKGRELSSVLRWGFSETDLKNLAKLHKANKYRKKIEDLLTDCNFHSECTAMSSGDYSAFFSC